VKDLVALGYDPQLVEQWGGETEVEWMEGWLVKSEERIRGAGSPPSLNIVVLQDQVSSLQTSSGSFSL